jgi:hypothetical protein
MWCALVEPCTLHLASTFSRIALLIFHNNEVFITDFDLLRSSSEERGRVRDSVSLGPLWSDIIFECALGENMHLGLGDIARRAGMSKLTLILKFAGFTVSPVKADT